MNILFNIVVMLDFLSSLMYNDSMKWGLVNG